MLSIGLQLLEWPTWSTYFCISSIVSTVQVCWALVDLAFSSNLCNEWAFPFRSVGHLWILPLVQTFAMNGPFLLGLGPYQVEAVSANHFFPSNHSNVLPLVMATEKNCSHCISFKSTVAIFMHIWFNLSSNLLILLLDTLGVLTAASAASQKASLLRFYCLLSIRNQK